MILTLEEFRDPIVVMLEGKSGAFRDKAHLTDTRHPLPHQAKTLCGLEDVLFPSNAKIADLAEVGPEEVCQKCAQAMSSHARLKRLV